MKLKFQNYKNSELYL